MKVGTGFAGEVSGYDGIARPPSIGFVNTISPLPPPGMVAIPETISFKEDRASQARSSVFVTEE
jgi:hypothetical protein